MLNCYEETPIRNHLLPIEWQSQAAQDELSDFLQANWEQRAVFFDDGVVTSRQQFLTFGGQKSIRTGKYIGTIVFKGAQVNIFPKMFREYREDNDTSLLTLEHLMRNLIAWIDYCGKIEYPFISIKSELDDSNNLQELFVSLYVRYVRDALNRGVFYQYEDETDDVSSIKGTFNVSDYYTRKIPNGQLHKFNCNFSNFEFDNKLNQIIKCTCNQLVKIANKTNLKIIRDILFKLNDVSDVKCKPSDCDRIRLSKLHRNYSVVLSMSKMFLLNKSASYNVDNSESFCFLFPTDLLFEGFIGGFMRSILRGEAKVRLQASERSLIDDVEYEGESYGAAFRMRHDILVEHKDSGLFVLDTKYKHVSRFEGNPELKASLENDIDQQDLYQVREYAAMRGLDKAYLLYPLYRFEDLEKSSPKLKGKIELGGVRYNVDVYAVRLPFIFEDDIKATKTRLTTVIKSIF